MDCRLFLYIDPIKQGLKPLTGGGKNSTVGFLYIDPIKQGLKQTGDNQSNGNQ